MCWKTHWKNNFIIPNEIGTNIQHQRYGIEIFHRPEEFWKTQRISKQVSDIEKTIDNGFVKQVADLCIFRWCKTLSKLWCWTSAALFVKLKIKASVEFSRHLITRAHLSIRQCAIDTIGSFKVSKLVGCKSYSTQKFPCGVHNAWLKEMFVQEIALYEWYVYGQELLWCTTTQSYRWWRNHQSTDIFLFFGHDVFFGFLWSVASFLWQVLRHPEVFIITTNKKSAIQNIAHYFRRWTQQQDDAQYEAKTNEQHARKNNDFHPTASSDEVEYQRFCVYSLKATTVPLQGTIAGGVRR